MLNQDRRPPPWVMVAAFAAGPCVSAAVFAVGVLTVGWWITPAQDGVFEEFFRLLFGGLIYSSALTVVFGLPVYLVWVWRGWFGYRAFAMGGLLSGGIASLVLVLASSRNVGSLIIGGAIVPLATLNAVGMWFVLKALLKRAPHLTS